MIPDKANGCPGVSFIIDASTANSQSCSTNPNSKSTNPFYAQNQAEETPEEITDDGPEEDTEITVEIIEELVATITPYQERVYRSLVMDGQSGAWTENLSVDKTKTVTK